MGSKKDKKNKKNMEVENKSEAVVEHDSVDDKDHTRSKKEKKRKLKHKEKKDAVELISVEEETEVKKEKRNKVKKKKGSDVAYAEAFENEDVRNDQSPMMGENSSRRRDGIKKDNGENLRKDVMLGLTNGEERKKEKRKTNKKAVSSTSIEIGKDEEVKGTKEIIGSKQRVEGDVSNIMCGLDHNEMKKKQKKMKTKETKGMDHCGGTVLFQSEMEEEEVKRSTTLDKKERKVKGHLSAASKPEFLKEKDCLGGGSEEMVQYGKVRHKEIGVENDIEGCSSEFPIDNSIGVGKAILGDKDVADREGNSGVSSKKKRDREKGVHDVETELGNKNRKRSKLAKDVSGKRIDKGDLSTEDREGSLTDHSRNPKTKNSSKSVKFSSHVEVFPLNDAADVEKESEAGNLVRGKRFSPKEDKLILDAIQNYIEAHELGEGGVDMLLNVRKYPELRNSWREIGAAIPWRPVDAMKYRASTLLTRSEKRIWTDEEKEQVKEHYKRYGPKWKPLADALGKDRRHLKDVFRRNKHDYKKGPWSQEEYQALFDLVNMDLQMKVFEEKRSKHGMLRENISWEAISEKLRTRGGHHCCLSWYNKLTSPMVKAMEWADVDDYRLVNELYDLDACCEEDVDWDNLLDHRSGAVCRRRWLQMVRYIGDNVRRSFADQVQVLAERYCPKLIEVREAVDSRPIVPSGKAPRR